MKRSDRRHRWECFSVTKHDEPSRRPITWERAAAIFKHPKPPQHVWEKQFDYSDSDLQRIARTPYQEFDFDDLWYYHHDLAYVELQPELFAYLFPVCLMDWHQTLMENKACSHGDSEFHYGLYHGKVLEKMTTPYQQKAIYDFFRDSFLDRLDCEQGYQPTVHNAVTAHGWILRFNSLGFIMPRIDQIWNFWWSLETVGQAVAALQYCSGLMYFEGDNPLFPIWTAKRGGGGPYLWQSDASIHHGGWLPENVEFLSSVLTIDFLSQKIREACNRLKDEPLSKLAEQLAEDFPTCQELLEFRCKELPSLLSDVNSEGWSV